MRPPAAGAGGGGEVGGPGTAAAVRKALTAIGSVRTVHSPSIRLQARSPIGAMLRLHALALASVFVLVAIVAGVAPALAQDRGGITGKVSDQRTAHAIPFATVTVTPPTPGNVKSSSLEPTQNRCTLGGPVVSSPLSCHDTHIFG